MLRRWARRRQIAVARARQALDDLRILPIVRYPARVMLDCAWDLRCNLTAYDAQYVALAQAVPGPLLTIDGRMAAAASLAGVATVSTAQ